MAFGLRGSGSNGNDAAGTSLAATVTGVQAGDLVAVFVKHEVTAGTLSVSDGTSSLTPATKRSHTNADFHGQWFYLLASIATGSVTYTATYPGAATFRAIEVYVFSTTGLASFDVEALSVVGANSPGGSIASGTFTTTGTDEVVLGGYGNYGGGIVTSPLVAGSAASGQVTDASSNASIFYRILSATVSGQTVSASQPVSGDFILNAIAFKATSSISGSGGVTFAKPTLSGTGTVAPGVVLMPEVWVNNGISTLASGITSGATSLSVQAGHGARFPALTAPDFFFATLTNTAESQYEIIKVTARATDTFTIERAQQGTSAAAWSSGDKVENRLTKGTLEGLIRAAITDVVTASHATQKGEARPKTLTSQLTGGVDETPATAFVATKITLPDDELGSVALWIKRDAGLTGGDLRVFLFSDSAGSPGAEVTPLRDGTGNPSIIYAPQLTTSFVRWTFRLPYSGLTPAASAWIVVQIGNLVGGTIILERRSAGTNIWATSTGGAWSLVNTKELKYELIAPSGMGMYGYGENDYGGKFETEVGIAVRGIATGLGCGGKFDSVTNFGVGGTSQDGLGVRGSSNRSIAVQGVGAGNSSASAGGQFQGPIVGMQVIATDANGLVLQAVGPASPATLLQLLQTPSYAELFQIDGNGRINLKNNQPIRGLNAAGATYYDLLKLNALDQIELARSIFSPLVSLGAGSAIDWAAGNMVSKSLTGNWTPTFAGGASGGLYTLSLTQDATGGRTVTWPAAVLWANGRAPRPGGPNAVQRVDFFYNGTNYIGSYIEEDAKGRVSGSNVTTTGVAAVDATGLTFNGDAGEVWSFEAELKVSCGTGGVKFAVNGPSGTVPTAQIIGGASATVTAFTSSLLTALNTLSTEGYAVSATRGVRIAGIVVIGGTAGAVTIRFASLTNGQTSTIFVGSYINARRM